MRSSKMFKRTESMSKEGTYVTFVGIGVDFNTAAVEKISQIKGCSYMSVKNSREFKKVINVSFLLIFARLHVCTSCGCVYELCVRVRVHVHVSACFASHTAHVRCMGYVAREYRYNFLTLISFSSMLISSFDVFVCARRLWMLDNCVLVFVCVRM